jgi:hypothetical protein
VGDCLRSHAQWLGDCMIKTTNNTIEDIMTVPSGALNSNQEMFIKVLLVEFNKYFRTSNIVVDVEYMPTISTEYMQLSIEIDENLVVYLSTYEMLNDLMELNKAFVDNIYVDNIYHDLVSPTIYEYVEDVVSGIFKDIKNE